MTAGRRKHVIRIERETDVGRDSLNDPIVEWVELATHWGAVYFGSGREQREAAQTQGEQAASFEVLYDALTASVTPKDRVIFDGAIWDVKSAAPVGFNKDMKINATRATV